MRYEKSCGFVVFKKIDNNIYYLIIESLNGDIGFPKGHIEKNESEIQTAIRELKEETNLEVKVIDGFRYQIQYEILSLKDTIKEVVYFLGECIYDNIVCQEQEVSSAKFVTYNEALKLLTFSDCKKILIEADKLLNDIL